ncbi:hypothetical protein F8388_016387 [Cannabis sativa]|uniref:RNase H type-1 domain-containing protein n=1 Tax=Cannabis sativa TaxID=3483 RepID=A0A7J6HKC9_CANSA|nr:hypothetical protein F8388_016387 [Cannabis sativa]KAF4395707.1 hypothetical protein G4B88_013481 [Cannabis sativa]
MDISLMMLKPVREHIYGRVFCGGKDLFLNGDRWLICDDTQLILYGEASPIPSILSLRRRSLKILLSAFGGCCKVGIIGFTINASSIRRWSLDFYQRAVVRDHTGVVIASMTSPFNAYLFALVAEAMAVFQGLLLCSRLGLANVDGESDCQRVCLALTNKTPLQEEFGSRYFTSTNTLAHNLAHFALSLDCAKW